MGYKYNIQDGIKDCGINVLYNIIRYYKGNINYEKLRTITNASKDGTSIYDIVTASKKVGLIATAYHCEINDLNGLNFPIVAHLFVEEKYPHFVIIKKIQDDIIYIFDPIRGHLKYTFTKFIKEWSNNIIIFEKTNNLINEKDNYYYFIKNQLNNHKKSIIIISILSVICTFLSILNSFYIQNLIDNPNNNKTFIIFLLISLICVFITFFKNKYIIKFNSIFDSKFTKNIYKHILNLPIKYHHNRPAGDIVSRVYDLYSIKNFINELSSSIIINILLVIFIYISLFFINKIIFLIVTLFSIIYICIYLLNRSNLNNMILANQEINSKVNSELVENLLGIDSIKNLNLEEKFIQKQSNSYDNLINDNISINNKYNNISLFHELIESFGIIIIIFISNIFIKNKVLSIGFLVTINTLVINLFSTLKQILSYDNIIINSKNAYRRINELVAVEEEKNKKSKNFNNNIQINNFNYSYNNIKHNLKFNLNINKNDYILINGKSGIGKSTIFKALTKQIDCNKNMILLDGITINNFSNKYIKKKICYVSQNEYIFTDTIKNNITMYNNVSNKELNKVLKISMIDKIIKDKNITINYLLEENGHNLSGGERQKILIARALLSKRNLIIFDETMNEIDVESERTIIKNIKTEYKKTLILISHRLNNEDLFNKIIQL